MLCTRGGVTIAVLAALMNSRMSHGWVGVPRHGDWKVARRSRSVTWKRFAADSSSADANEKGNSGAKGFGKVPPPSSSPAGKKKKKSSGGGSVSPTFIDLGGPSEMQLAADAEDFPEVSERAVQALAELEAQSQSRDDGVQQKMDSFEEVQKVLEENPTAGVIPDAVAKRMLSRMLPLAAIPVFGGIGLFVFFYFSATRGDFEVPPAIVAYATTAPWLLGLAGLTYGIISSSWDEDVEGSFLGFDEFQTNIDRILEGLRRGSENQELRELQNKQQKQDKRKK